MSGRYAIQFNEADRDFFGVGRGNWNFPSAYNVKMGDMVPVIRLTRGKAEVLYLRWGLIPFTSKGKPNTCPLTAARADKLESSYPWNLPWQRGQRCILPATGFYKWHENEEGRREPYFVRLAGSEVFGMAGIWDRSITEDREAIESCAIITMTANKLVHWIHNAGEGAHRMPAILRSEDFGTWLRGKPSQARRLLTQYPAEYMKAYRVGNRVNGVENDDEELIQPVLQELPELDMCGTD